MILALVVGTVSLIILSISLIIDGEVLDFGGDWFSISGIAAFFGLAGFTTLGAMAGGAPPLLTGILALTVGALGLVGMGYVLRFLKASSTEHETSLDMLRGDVGKVTTEITVSAPGQIAATLSGLPVRLSAVSEEPLAVGDSVLILDILSPTQVLVRPLP